MTSAATPALPAGTEHVSSQAADGDGAVWASACPAQTPPAACDCLHARYVCLKERNLVTTQMEWRKGTPEADPFKDRYKKVGAPLASRVLSDSTPKGSDTGQRISSGRIHREWPPHREQSANLCTI